MQFKNIPTQLLFCASLASALPRNDPSASKSCTDSEILAALAGTYSLVNTTSALNGVPIPDEAYGSAPVGLLIYTATGFMSATITATEPEYRPNLTFPFQPNDTDADWAAVGRHSIGYAGPLRISDAIPANKTNGQVFHGPLTVANVPTWVGANQRRNYTIIQEGGATLLKIGSERGGGYTGTLWWKRIEGS
ncbi:Lipocalin-like domain-containing protein [Phaeosphaeria sp. MPI-PUGE-AT-0046c]|nr:Lipocalin-like domain-containing protein [Phaeosphaeria sp. MPI-PUGE-AT-0046c]